MLYCIIYTVGLLFGLLVVFPRNLAKVYVKYPENSSDREIRLIDVVPLSIVGSVFWPLTPLIFIGYYICKYMARLLNPVFKLIDLGFNKLIELHMPKAPKILPLPNVVEGKSGYRNFLLEEKK